jgi:hypothetical protein
MPRVRPRKTEYYSTAKPRASRPGTGPLVQAGWPTESLRALLSEPLEIDRGPELDALEASRAESTEFLRAMAEGEE